MFSRLRPARSMAESSEVVADLDEMVGRDLRFRLNGKEYSIKKMSTETFIRVLNGFDLIQQKIRQSKVTEEEALDCYTNLFKSCIDGMNEKTVKDMTIAQVSALSQLILEHATGKMGLAEEIKKKTQAQASP